MTTNSDVAEESETPKDLCEAIHHYVHLYTSITSILITKKLEMCNAQQKKLSDF